MKLIDRYQVEGTDPVIYIGHRPYRGAGGADAVSRTWYAEYNFHGEPQYEALGERNKQAAIRKAHRIIERLERGEFKPIVRKVEWAELQDKYLDFQTSRNRGPKTLEKYKHGLKSLLEFAAAQGISSPAKFTPDHFWAFGKQLRDLEKGSKTVFDRLMFVKMVFRWAHQKAKLLSVNVLISESPEKPPPTEQPCFTADQVRMILDKASDADKRVFALMAFTGLRFGEVRDLRWADLHLDRGQHGQIFVKRGGSRTTTKGKANRVIPIHAELRSILDKLPKAGELIFHEPPETLRDPNQLVPLKERKLLARLKRTCKKCGFENHKKYKLHTFRHAFASMCAANNISHKYALEWMGHKSSEILDLYYKMFDDVADAAMAQITYTKPGAKAA